MVFQSSDPSLFWGSGPDQLPFVSFPIARQGVTQLFFVIQLSKLVFGGRRFAAGMRFALQLQFLGPR